MTGKNKTPDRSRGSARCSQLPEGIRLLLEVPGSVSEESSPGRLRLLGPKAFPLCPIHNQEKCTKAPRECQAENSLISRGVIFYEFRPFLGLTDRMISVILN